MPSSNAAAAASPGVSAMRDDLDAATAMTADVHEAQWRSGVNRQAQPDALELQGTLSEQSTIFDRLRDKILGHRRGRAHPSGTPRQGHFSEQSS